MHFFKKGCKKLIYESSLTEKKIQFLETIPKTKESIKKKSEKKEYDLAKETVKFLRHNDYALKSHVHVFILQKEVWSESQISLNW